MTGAVMAQRLFVAGDPRREPRHRQLVSVVIAQSGAVELAAYNADEKSFYLKIGDGWLDIGTEPIAQRPTVHADGLSADEIESRQRLPWWLRLDAAGRREMTRRKRQKR